MERLSPDADVTEYHRTSQISVSRLHPPIRARDQGRPHDISRVLDAASAITLRFLLSVTGSPSIRGYSAIPPVLFLRSVSAVFVYATWSRASLWVSTYLFGLFVRG